MKIIPLKNVERRKIDKPSQAYFPPILSVDPVTAANSLTIRDSNIALNSFRQFYLNIGSPNEYPLLYESVFHSFESFMWFATFFKELEKQYGFSGEDKFSIPYESAPQIKDETLPIPPPLFLVPTGDAFSIFYKNIRLRRNDLIYKHKADYIGKQLELTDFKDGFPSWYTFSRTPIFETYCEKTNRRVKIMHKDGEYRYFISGASDNWQEIFDVPLEIDDVVTAILFRN